MSDPLAELVSGNTDTLKLEGPPIPSARDNLRRLQELGLLTPETVWMLLGHAPVDPLFIIRVLRTHKKELGFAEDDHLVGDRVAFSVLDKDVVVEVSVFDNDIFVTKMDGLKASRVKVYRSEDIFTLISKHPVGATRLKALLDMVKEYVTSISTEVKDVVGAHNTGAL